MKQLFLSVALLATLAGSLNASDAAVIGIVNFSNCIAESKAGKKEQDNMENLRKQMASMIESVEKELREISAKFDDTDYLDELSPKAEEELKLKHQALQEDLGRYQQQFYQVLSHANQQVMQKMVATIATASEKIAEEKNLDYVINRDACFYVRSDLDITNLVVVEMDRSFDLETKQQEQLSEYEQEAGHATDRLMPQAG